MHYFAVPILVIIFKSIFTLGLKHQILSLKPGYKAESILEEFPTTLALDCILKCQKVLLCQGISLGDNDCILTDNITNLVADPGFQSYLPIGFDTEISCSQAAEASFSSHKGRIYIMDTGLSGSYSEAKLYCQSLGQHVTVGMPNSLESWNALFVDLNLSNMWIGLENQDKLECADEECIGKLQWTNGNSFNYDVWNSGKNFVINEGIACIRAGVRDIGDLDCSQNYKIVCQQTCPEL